MLPSYLSFVLTCRNGIKPKVNNYKKKMHIVICVPIRTFPKEHAEDPPRNSTIIRLASVNEIVVR